MSTKKALLPTPATSPDRGTQTLISVSRFDRLAPAIEDAPPTALAVINAPAINLRVMFMMLLPGAMVGGFMKIYADQHRAVRRPACDIPHVFALSETHRSVS